MKTVLPTRRSPALFLGAFLACFSLNGCIVAGASSSGGRFIWPGGFGLVVLIVILLLVFRRR